MRLSVIAIIYSDYVNDCYKMAKLPLAEMIKPDHIIHGVDIYLAFCLW